MDAFDAERLRSLKCSCQNGTGPLTYKGPTHPGSTKNGTTICVRFTQHGLEGRGRGRSILLYTLGTEEEGAGGRVLIGFDTYSWMFVTEFVQEKGNTGGWRCPVVRCLLGPNGDFKSNKLCASDITYLKRLSKGAWARCGSSSLPVTGGKKCGATSQLTDPVVCIASPPFRPASNRLGQCPDFKSEWRRRGG